MKEYEQIMNYDNNYYVMVSDEDFFIYNDLYKEIIIHGDNIITLANYLESQNINNLEINKYTSFDLLYLYDEIKGFANSNKELLTNFKDELKNKLRYK